MAKRAVPFPRSYVNTPVRDALAAFEAAPSIEGIQKVLALATTGGLVVDVTGSTPASGPRVRTLTSTDGELVLPLFTSLSELGLAVPEAERADVQGTILPGRDALAIVESAEIVAVQFDAGSRQVIVKRSLVDEALTAK
ncbi:SseB family protein [Agreia sp. COWG]|uniref:SseB family protein n=1 Tax=Agreia sp. COWG TaxID=2773266 RepID=UPI001925A361|nr:SseB family protein [Agreia sp. COWG]CAD5989277.1 SseB domain-containing protein [Agreia sp. COWG]